MTNYQNGKIYKIINIKSNNDSDCYVGSTCQTLHKRMLAHRSNSRTLTYKTGSLYDAMNKYGVDNFRIILVEDWPCKTKWELTAREEHHRVKIGAGYNVVSCHNPSEKVEAKRKLMTYVTLEDKEEEKRINTQVFAAIEKDYWERQKALEKKRERETARLNRKLIIETLKEIKKKGSKCTPNEAKFLEVYGHYLH